MVEKGGGMDLKKQAENIQHTFILQTSKMRQNNLPSKGVVEQS